MERNLLYNEIASVLSNGLSGQRFQRELPDSELKNSGTIHYVDLEAGKFKFPNSAIFIPDYFKMQGNTVDIILYFHGLIIPPCLGDPNAYGNLGMKSYLENNKFFESTCPGIAESKKNVIFIAVTWLMKWKEGKYFYEGRSKSRNHVRAQDFNDLMNSCLAGIRSATKNGTSDIGIGNIIMAAHSAGGAPMQRIIAGADTKKVDQGYLSKVKECWGFDSQYNASTDVWVKWLTKQNQRVYKHFSVGQPSRKGFDVSKFRVDKPKSAVQPYMHISNLWRSLKKNKSMDNNSYYFASGKTSHCGIVDKYFKGCVVTSKALNYA